MQGLLMRIMFTCLCIKSHNVMTSYESSGRMLELIKIYWLLLWEVIIK